MNMSTTTDFKQIILLQISSCVRESRFNFIDTEMSLLRALKV